MHLEGSKDLVGMTECGEEAVTMAENARHRIFALEQARDGGLVEDAEHLAPHCRLDGTGGVEAVVYGTEILLQHIGGERERWLDIVEMSRATGT